MKNSSEGQIDFINKTTEQRIKQAGFRFDAMFYMQDFLNKIKILPKKELDKILVEIGTKGISGFDMDGEKKYSIATLGMTNCTGMQMFSGLYCVVKALDKNMNPGMDLQSEYESALLFVNVQNDIQ